MKSYGRKEMMAYHRLLSWWLMVFAILSILSGYVVTREWSTNLAFWEETHLIIQWTFIVIFLFHMIYTIGWVRIKTFKLLKNHGKNWVRILQQLTKWLIVVFTIIVVFTGLSYYDWMDILWFKTVFPFVDHVNWDFYLSQSIIIHLMTGIKIALIRNQKSTRFTSVTIMLGGVLLTSGLVYLEFFSTFR